MDSLQRMYAVAAQNIKWAREKQTAEEREEVAQKLKVNDLVLVRDPDSPVFHPKYLPNYRIKEIHGGNRIVVQDEKGNISTRRSSHVKKCPLKDKIAMMVPTDMEYSQFGRPAKLLIHPKDVPQLDLPAEENASDAEKDEISSSEIIQCAELNLSLKECEFERDTITPQNGEVQYEISPPGGGGFWHSLRRMVFSRTSEGKNTSPQTGSVNFTFSP